MRKKVKILSWHNIRSAYSCLHYLKNELGKYCDVELWSLTSTNMIEEGLGEGYVSFFDKKYWKIPKIRSYIAKLNVFKMMVDCPEDIYIINDLDFIIPAYFAKKLKKGLRIIQYNTEIAGKDVYVKRTIKDFYYHHPDFPDMIGSITNFM